MARYNLVTFSTISDRDETWWVNSTGLDNHPRRVKKFG